MRDYSMPESALAEATMHSSKMRGGKLMPVACVPFRPSESGILSQEIFVELEPIAGRLISDIICEVTAIYVPALACDALYNADQDHAGNAEIFRQRLEDGVELFPMEGETEITKRMGLEPISINGVLQTNSISRLAHNAAVNYMRLRKYHSASQLAHGNVDVTPALLSTTALDRFNAVLTPEDRVNGAVKLQGEIPIAGLGLRATHTSSETFSGVNQNSGTGVTNEGEGWYINSSNDDLETRRAQVFIEQDPTRPGFPHVRADFALGTGQQLSLTQFHQAERQDELVRLFRAMIDANPEQGQEMVTRMVHGLKVETGKIPYQIFTRTVALSASMRTAMDGDNLDLEQTNTAATIPFSVVVPKNEFGGCVVTFLTVKPEEVISGQPHPVFSKPWGVDNHAADELAIDPVKVIARELDSSVDQADEETVMFYVGNNHLRRSYERRDWSRDVDPTTIDHKSTLWRYNVPISVSPENIIYPDDIDHYPFALNGPTDPVASYTVKSAAQIQSPTILGPSPIEEVQIVEDEDLFEEEDA